MDKDQGEQVINSNLGKTEQKKQNEEKVEEILLPFKETDLTELQPRLTHQFVNEFLKDPKNDYALGSMFAAFMADALGSYCEFRHYIEEQLLEQTMQMRGGGTFSIRAGQFTDDSQMATHMLSGLCSYDPNKSFLGQEYSILKNIAVQYKNWGKSEPFDIGMTTRSAVSTIGKLLYDNKVQNKDVQDEEFIEAVLPKIYSKNKDSQANGSLMRITPMCLFSAFVDKQNNFPQNLIKKQIQLTHPNHTLVHAGYAWVELISKIIRRNQDKTSLQTIYDEFIDKHQKDQLLKSWVATAKQQELMPGNPQMGWAKIAFSYGINKMRSISNLTEESLNQNIYTHVIKDVIGKAGDTDTNGAIVGGLVGSILGFRRLPKVYLKKMFALRLSLQQKSCSYRSKFYQPRRAFIKGIHLIQMLQKGKK